MVVGISSMFSSTAASEDVLYLIPIYNSVQILTQIFTFQINSWQFILMVIANVVTAGLFTILLTRMFSSERSCYQNKPFRFNDFLIFQCK
jgi:sodium transport system permease protein